MPGKAGAQLYTLLALATVFPCNANLTSPASVCVGTATLINGPVAFPDYRRRIYPSMLTWPSPRAISTGSLVWRVAHHMPVDTKRLSFQYQLESHYDYQHCLFAERWLRNYSVGR